MALQIPQGLYSQFTEVLDSSPTANMIRQNQLRKQAKEEALDEYDRKRLLDINDKGVRNIDREQFDGTLADIQYYYNQNKDAIRKGNTPQAYEFEQKFRNINNLVNQSKEATAKEDAAMKLYHDIFKVGGIVPEDDENGLNFIKDLESHKKTIGDPERRDFNLEKYMSYVSKPFNQQSFLKKYSDIKRVAGDPRYEDIKDQPLRKTEIIEESFDDAGKNIIRTKSASDYHNDFSFNKEVKTLMKDPTKVLQLSEVFKNAYGGMPETEEDYAAAYTISMLQPTTRKTKVVDDKGAIMDKRQKQKIDYAYVNNALIKGRQKLSGSGGNLSNYDVLGLYFDKAKPHVIKKDVGGFLKPKYEETTEYRIPANEVDASHKKLFGGTEPYGDNTTGKYYIVREDGDWEGKNGQVISRYSVATQKQNQTSLSEERRGVPDLKGNKTQPTIKKKKITW